MSRFLTNLNCRYVTPWTFHGTVWEDNNGIDRWQLLNDFEYSSTLLKRVVIVPEGFKFDKASVPDLLSPNFAGRFTRAALVHDYLIRTAILRSKADKVFLEAMRVEIEEELSAMREAGIDDDEIVDFKNRLEGRAQLMYAAVCLRTKLENLF